ncbi:calcium-binding protein [Myxosarcina sp. GI1(2024)]
MAYKPGTQGDDLLIGSNVSDYISGFQGDNRLIGNNGNDDLRGDGGKDSLKGGGDNDFLIGGIGSDELDGGRGNDTLIGFERGEKDATGVDHLGFAVEFLADATGTLDLEKKAAKATAAELYRSTLLSLEASLAK